MDDETKTTLEAMVAMLDDEIDANIFWKAADDELILQHGEHARRWLAMLEDPDPDDLIFDYMKITRNNAYMQGFLVGLNWK